jgi:hypothetical protein
VAEQKEEGFKVIDRRPFNSEGDLRKDAAEIEEREARVEAAKEQVIAAAQPKATAPAAAGSTVPAKEAPKKSQAFENLVRMIGSNAAMVLGAYADPRTGQPVLDPDAARELIDMLDALHEKTAGNLAPEEDAMLLDLLGKLKMTFVEINQAMAEQMAQMQEKVKGPKR